MKIVLASDSFKGTLSATQACRALEAGARRIFPDAELVAIPLADGGDGTLDTLMSSTAGRLKTAVVRGPLGDATEAHWGILPTGQAVIEMAQASGLGLVEPQRRDALAASSYGTGQLIRTALNAGCRDVVVALGGSATTDGGLGALSALGLRAFDDRDRVLLPGGGALNQLATLDGKFLDERLAKTVLTTLYDVSNPLYGTDGAAHSYGMQKGATRAEVKHLDSGLRHYATVIAQLTGIDNSNRIGAGAAGGAGFGLMAFCAAQMCSGIDFVLGATRFAERITGADFILTGEGTLDRQTLKGKAISGVCRLARTQNIPVIAFAGRVKLDSDEISELGLVSAVSLQNEARTPKLCIDDAATLLAEDVEKFLQHWK